MMRRWNSLPVAILLTWGFLLLQAVARVAKAGPSTDVVWNVQVLQRLLDGGVLYRDVFFGAAPLSMYVLELVARTGVGAEILAVLLVSILSQMGVIALCLAMAHRSGVRHLLALGLAMLVVGYPWLEPPYTPIALLFLALSAFLTVRLAEPAGSGGKTSSSLCFLAGAAAGASFCAKQTLGLLSVLAAALSLAVRWRSEARFPATSILLLAGGFVSAVALLLLPVVATGGLEGFIDYGFTGKTRYLTLSGLSYLGEWEKAGNWRQAAVFLAPVVGTLLILSSWVGPSSNRRIAFPLLLFSGAAVCNAFPRADFWHLNGAVPFLWTAVAVSWSGRIPIARTSLPGLLLVLVLAAGFLAPLRHGFDALLDGEVTISEERHVRGLPMPERFAEQWRESASALPPATGEDAFLLFPEASRYYLAAGIQNPTPFDYPLATAFGGAGERETLERIRRGEIDQVIVGTRHPELALNSTLLLDFVEKEMEGVESRGPFRLYVLPGGSSPVQGDPRERSRSGSRANGTPMTVDPGRGEAGRR